MVKFCVYEDNFEFRADLRPTGATAAQIWSMYDSQIDRNPQLQGQYETIEEARAELAHVHPYSDHQRGFVHQLVVGRLGWIEENEFDEDGDFDQTIAILDTAVADLKKASGWDADED